MRRLIAVMFLAALAVGPASAQFAPGGGGSSGGGVPVTPAGTSSTTAGAVQGVTGACR
jgi:hypothetical protein